MSRTLRALSLLLLTLVLVGVGAVLGLFLLRNAQWVVVRLPVAHLSLSDPISVEEYETPLAVAILLSCAVGALLATLAVVPSWLRRGVERRRQQRTIDDLRGELSDLRNLPLSGPAPLEEAEFGAGKRRSREDDADELLLQALRGEGDKDRR